MKRKNIVAPVLILISLLVWGNNAYQIFVGLTRTDEEPADEPSPAVQETSGAFGTPAADDTAFVYRDDVRDPFQPGFRKNDQNPKSSAARKAPRIIEPPPSLRFCGVVTDSSGRLAIIEGPDGESALVREKGVVAGVSVLSIHNDHIECEFGKLKFTVELKQ